MKGENGPLTILVVDDDEDDRMIIARALQQHRGQIGVVAVNDGQEMVEYLRREGPYADARSYPRPALILLDLNMPRMNGMEALRLIKSDPEMRRIPVVILTTSDAEVDVKEAYNVGANAFVRKPVTFAGLRQALGQVSDFWFDVARRP